jgi:hypothetical protein
MIFILMQALMFRRMKMEVFKKGTSITFSIKTNYLRATKRRSMTILFVFLNSKISGMEVFGAYRKMN